jgi:hypothetical protein
VSNGFFFESEVMMRLTLRILPICILFLFACEPTRVKIQSEKTYPSKPSPTEPPQAKPSPKETPQEKPSAVEPPRGKTYADAISQWKSYQDLVRWMEKDFSVDMERFKKFEGTLPVPRAPHETFQRKSGIYIDAAIFVEETLNRIDPSYKARVVVLVTRPSGLNHYVCSFEKEGKIFIMDYGTPYQPIVGVHGPFKAIEEYRVFFEKNHPTIKRVEAITYLR